ncbi:MAG: division/cell wall cluster transcriptional repressor MraZ [Opitutales bacterium]
MDQPAPMHFVGEFRHSLDEKGRLTVPAKWRPRGEGGSVTFLAMPNPEGYITVYPPDRLAELRDKMRRLGMKDRKKRAALTQFLSRLHEFEFDRSGRIKLSDTLIRHAGIEKDAVLLGELASFAIYSPDRYEAQMPASTEEMDAVFEEFEL